MDLWTERLSEYLDDTLPPEEREALEGHLATCEDCRVVLGHLAAVAAQARGLHDRNPERDLWSGIATSIATPNPVPTSSPGVQGVRRVSFSIPQLIAASLALVVTGAGTTWLVERSSNVESTRVTLAAADSSTTAPTVLLTAGDLLAEKSEAAIADLERILVEGRHLLRPETVHVIDEKLALIDRVIAEAQAALANDPGSAYLNDYVNRKVRQKLKLLRHTAAMVQAQS